MTAILLRGLPRTRAVSLLLSPDHHDNRGRTRRCGHTGNRTEGTGTGISAVGTGAGARAGAAMGAVTSTGYIQPLEGWPCVGCGTAMYVICHRAFPFVVIEFVVSESDKSVDTFGCTSIVLSICSSLLLSARNSRRQLEVDLCTAQTRNGIKIQNTARISAQSTTAALRIPSSDIALPRSSISLCCNGMFLPESP